MKLFRQVNCIFLVPAEKLDCITCRVGRCEIWDVRNKTKSSGSRVCLGSASFCPVLITDHDSTQPRVHYIKKAESGCLRSLIVVAQKNSVSNDVFSPACSQIHTDQGIIVERQGGGLR